MGEVMERKSKEELAEEYVVEHVDYWDSVEKIRKEIQDCLNNSRYTEATLRATCDGCWADMTAVYYAFVSGFDAGREYTASEALLAQENARLREQVAHWQEAAREAGTKK